ncbi:MAG: hypothetical protein JW818_14150 [Pirellulales bacterium]|nr:hypothetical protein [Pirellulales bacterium]
MNEEDTVPNSVGRILLIALCCWWIPVGFACAQEAKASKKSTIPLYEQDPYDIIILTPQHKSERLTVQPLNLGASRRLPKNPRRTARLKVRLVDEPEKEYELRWSSIQEVILFEQLVLKKARELTQAGNREEAFNYLQYLTEKDPRLPGLAEAVDEYLLSEYRFHARQNDTDAALIALRELYDHNPRHPDLPDALGKVNQTLLERYTQKGNYAAARTLLKVLFEEFPDHPVATGWRSQLRKKTADLLAKAKTALQKGRLRQADTLGRQAMQIWPEEPGAAELVAEIQKQYPRVLVGVREPAESVDPTRRTEWASRRSSRLVWRTLTELIGPGPEGGDYQCPFGTLEMDPLNRGFTLQLRPGVHWSKGPAILGGADVARRLLDMATPTNPAYKPAWADLFGSVAVEDVYRVDVELRRPHVRCDALLQTIVPCYDAVSGSASLNIPNGPFVLGTKKPESTVYLSNRQYFIRTTGQAKEIVEQVPKDDRDAIRRLRDGRIQVLDRVYPWELEEYRSLDNVTVQRYGLPLVHCLICNTKRPVMAKKHFRRALAFGIPREEILEKGLFGRQEEKGSEAKPMEPGCEVLSGPFLKGDSYTDPVGYAYDTSIAPRPCERELAMMLACVVVDEMEAEARQKAAANQPQAAQNPPAQTKTETLVDPSRPRPPIKLTLAHPPTPTARRASEKIRDQLRVVNIDVTLKELPPGPLRPPGKDVDLLYAELPLWEPIIDAPWLLGPDGPTGSASPYMIHVLGKLTQAADWREARPLLHQIHQIAHDEVAVIPLWQLVEFFAYNNKISGLGQRPVGLYQNVEKWRLSSPQPEETP